MQDATTGQRRGKHHNNDGAAQQTRGTPMTTECHAKSGQLGQGIDLVVCNEHMPCVGEWREENYNGAMV